jgi:hypothetical protein
MQSWSLWPGGHHAVVLAQAPGGVDAGLTLWCRRSFRTSLSPCEEERAGREMAIRLHMLRFAVHAAAHHPGVPRAQRLCAAKGRTREKAGGMLCLLTAGPLMYVADLHALRVPISRCGLQFADNVPQTGCCARTTMFWLVTKA